MVWIAFSFLAKGVIHTTIVQTQVDFQRRVGFVNIDEPHMTRYDLIFSVTCASCLTIIYLH